MFQKTALRQRMLDELRIRNYAPFTVRARKIGNLVNPIAVRSGSSKTIKSRTSSVEKIFTPLILAFSEKAHKMTAGVQAERAGQAS